MANISFFPLPIQAWFHHLTSLFSANGKQLNAKYTSKNHLLLYTWVIWYQWAILYSGTVIRPIEDVFQRRHLGMTQEVCPGIIHSKQKSVPTWIKLFQKLFKLYITILKVGQFFHRIWETNTNLLYYQYVTSTQASYSPDLMTLPH